MGFLSILLAFALYAAAMACLFLNIICQCHNLCVGNSFIHINTSSIANISTPLLVLVSEVGGSVEVEARQRRLSKSQWKRR